MKFKRWFQRFLEVTNGRNIHSDVIKISAQKAKEQAQKIAEEKGLIWDGSVNAQIMGYRRTVWFISNWKSRIWFKFDVETGELLKQGDWRDDLVGIETEVEKRIKMSKKEACAAARKIAQEENLPWLEPVKISFKENDRLIWKIKTNTHTKGSCSWFKFDAVTGELIDKGVNPMKFQHWFGGDEGNIDESCVKMTEEEAYEAARRIAVEINWHWIEPAYVSLSIENDRPVWRVGVSDLCKDGYNASFTYDAETGRLLNKKRWPERPIR